MGRGRYPGRFWRVFRIKAFKTLPQPPASIPTTRVRGGGVIPMEAPNPYHPIQRHATVSYSVPAPPIMRTFNTMSFFREMPSGVR